MFHFTATASATAASDSAPIPANFRSAAAYDASLVKRFNEGDQRAFTEIMGLREGGTRLTLDLPDVPGSLERVTRAVQPSNIISVATTGGEGGHRRFVMRVIGEGADRAANRLREAGIEDGVGDVIADFVGMPLGD